MKLYFSVIAILLAGLLHAQQPFQGVIQYKISAPEEGKDGDEGELLVMFGVNQIKMRFSEKDGFAKQTLLVNLDSAKIYTISNEEKTYTQRKLREVKKYDPPKPKKIAGLNTTPVDVSPQNAFGAFGALVSQGRLVFYVSDSLYYPIPSKFEGNPELILCYNNRIVLGCELFFNNNTFAMPGMEDKSNEKTITIEAFKVERKSVSPAEFVIPSDYTEDLVEAWSFPDTTVALDTSPIMLDSMKELEPPPPPPPGIEEQKKPAEKPKSKANKKSPAKKED